PPLEWTGSRGGARGKMQSIRQEEMARSRNRRIPARARCGAAETMSKERENGNQRWRCLTCGRSFERMLGNLLHRLKTDVGKIVGAVQVVHRGSLRAAAEQTGLNDETIAAWIKRLGEHAEVIAHTNQQSNDIGQYLLAGSK